MKKLIYSSFISVLAVQAPLEASECSHCDIFFSYENNKIVTSLGNVDEGAVINAERVFGAEMGEDFPDYTDEPGFYALAGALPSGYRLGWNATEGLKYWEDGQFVQTINESLYINYSSLNFIVGDYPVNGFDLAILSDGSFHNHLNYYLQTYDGSAPTQGIYLLELEFYTTAPDSENSDHVWIVFNNGLSEAEHEAAIEWVEENLAMEDHDDHGDDDDHDDHDHGDHDGHDHGGHYDLFFKFDNNELIPGLGSVSDGDVEYGERVVGVEMGEEFPNYTDEPGFYALPDMLPVGYSLGWNATSGLKAWNNGEFSQAMNESLYISYATLGFSVGADPVDGFSLSIEDDGSFHKHLDFNLQGNGKFDPAPGIYLLELEFYTTQPKTMHSEPVWIVFNNGLSEDDHEAAIEWVEDNLEGGHECEGDANSDDEVNVLDLLEVVGSFGSSGEMAADVNHDGSVDVLDLLMVVSNFGQICEDDHDDHDHGDHDDHDHDGDHDGDGDHDEDGDHDHDGDHDGDGDHDDENKKDPKSKQAKS